jgi:hypothetical protein
LILGLLSASLMPVPASAAVRVIEGEVIFTLRAPEAKRVFLSGDFNNWNPEVEEMVKEGDTFEWSLFLVAGEYRYKFVVDGQWMNDPDNPPEDPTLGSLLVLAETEQGLRIKEVDAEGRPLGASFNPSARYIGRFIYEDESLDADQRLDATLNISDKAYSAAAVFRSLDDSWELSPLGSDIFLDRGRVDAQVWKCRLTAFENDTVWTSSEPFALVGRRGVYLYNAGYGKRGLTFDIPLFGGLVCRALFADKLEGHSLVSVLAADGTRGTVAGRVEDDSTSYSYRLDDEDSDVWVVEALLRLGDYRAGIVSRIDRGLHPGRLHTMQSLDSLFENTVYRTDEQWQGTALWVSGKIAGFLDATAAYGHGTAYLHRRGRTVAVADAPVGIDTGRDTEEWDSRRKIQGSRRVGGALTFYRPALRCRLGADYNWFEFGPEVYAESEANVLRCEIETAYRWGDWTGALHVEYIDQDYGDAPPAFHIYSPERNYWLRGGDGFLPETIAGLDEESFSLVRLTFTNGRRIFVAGDHIVEEDQHDRGPLRITLEAGMNAGGIMASFDYGYSRIAIERDLYERFYVQLDSRGSVYDKSAWGDAKGFLASYIETGYRSGRMEISLGFGFDPVVLDAVRNEYFDIGRTEQLRQAAEKYSRGSGDEAGRRLLDLEHAIETDRSLKLECIIGF